MRGNVNLTDSKLDFYMIDMVLAVLILGLFFLLCFINKMSDIQLMGIFVILMTAFVLFEHKTFIIFNKDTNTLTIVKKALFIDKHMIIKQRPLTDFVTANLKIVPGRKGGSTYGVEMVTKTGQAEQLVPYYTSNYNHWFRMVNRIVNFYAGEDRYLELVEAPFIFRLIGIVFIIAYYCIVFCL